nr:Na-translocating system protein MpsC family protein [Sporolactobacillus pectinivorans]
MGGAVAIAKLLPVSLGEFKQELMKEYNLVNQMIFKVGVTEQKVSVFEDKVVIIAKHKRIPVLEIIDEADKNFSEVIDRLLIKRYKEVLAKNITRRFGIGVKLVLKDYDPRKEVSGTLIVLDENLNERGW